MASNFIPLNRDRSGDAAEPKAPASPFQPLGKPASPAGTKSPLGDPMAVAIALGLVPKSEPPKTSSPPSSGHGHQQMTPLVTARKEGDRITHLIVRCPCGTVTEIECQY